LAEAEHQAALRINPQFAVAAVNLADLYRQLGRDLEGVGVLQAAIERSPADAALHQALGLALVRLKRLEDALGSLRRAAELAPDRARYTYVYAVALHTAKRVDEAKNVLMVGLAKHPIDKDILLALVTFNRDAGDFVSALKFAERLAKIVPNDRALNSVIDQLKLHAKQ
jgi:Flp pilus assembly protein TadD